MTLLFWSFMTEARFLCWVGAVWLPCLRLLHCVAGDRKPAVTNLSTLNSVRRSLPAVLCSLMRHLEAARDEAAKAEDRADAAVAALAKAARNYARLPAEN